MGALIKDIQIANKHIKKKIFTIITYQETEK